MHENHPRSEPVSVPLCYYGSPEPLPPRRVLRAGPLACVYEAGDLRYVTVGGVEVCRRLYAAVRDEDWGTVPGVLSDEMIEETADGFRIGYIRTHRREEIDFVWRASIRIASYPPAAEWYGAGEGALVYTAHVRFEFDGEARSDFRRNRIGLCVLHPPLESVGKPVTVTPTHGQYYFTYFPNQIAPQNPFADFSQLTVGLTEHAFLNWMFSGDAFETEDQRNWTDASFKTFCTPLSRPFPVAVSAGERVRQAVDLQVSWPTTHPPASAATGSPTLACGTGPPTRIPDLGLGVGIDGRGIEPAFRRLDLDLTGPGWADALRAADRDAPLELAVTTSGDAAEIAALVPALAAARPQVERLLVVRAGEWATRPEDVLALAGAFAEAGLTPDLYGGTTASFAEFNRRRPPLDLVQGVCYSAQPQEHASDNASLVECCAALTDTVRSARAICGDKPLSVGPITLRKRVNPYATGPGWEPPPPDPRHRSLFGAGWTLAALKYLAESGVEFVSFAEPPGLPGWPVWLQPLYDLAGWAGAEVLPCVSSDPLSFDGLTVRRGGQTRVLLANLAGQSVRLAVTGMPSAVTVSVFEASNWTGMGVQRDYWWEVEAPGRATTTGGVLSLTLTPYAYVRIDG